MSHMEDEISDEQLVDLIIFAGVQEFRKRGLRPTGSILHWTKFIYYVAENLDLDLTRSWYRMGQYVWVENLNMDRIYHNAGIEIVPSLPPRERTERLIFGPLKDLYGEITSIVNELFDKIFLQTANELRLLIYRSEAPKLYRGLYEAEFNLEMMCKNILNLRDQEGISREYYPEISDLVSRYHIELSKSGISPSSANAAIEASSLLEMMVMKFDMCRSRGREWRARWFKEFENLFENYHKEGWSFPAADIALETIKGKKREDVIHFLRERQKQSDSFIYQELTRVKDHLRKADLIPTSDEIRSFWSGSQFHEEAGPVLANAMILYEKQGLNGSD